MHLNLSNVVAWVVCPRPLMGNCLVLYDGCYNEGTSWADLGDDNAIFDAFNRLCDNMSGTYKLHDNIVKCVNVNDHHIQAAIWPSDGHTHDYNHVDLSLDGCVDYMEQVKSRCYNHGGELDSLETDPDSEGGDWIKALVKVDPEDGSRHC